MRQTYGLIILVCLAMLAARQPHHADDPVERSVCELMEQYSEATLADIYKSAFQNRFGPGHLIADTASARQYLEYELAQPFIKEGKPYEPTVPTGRYVRVNLSLVKDGTLPVDSLLAALIESANTVDTVSIADWKEEWSGIMTTIRQLDLTFEQFEADSAAIANRLAEGRYVGHHSEAYTTAYDPHYRIIRRDIFETRILPIINRKPNSQMR